MIYKSKIFSKFGFYFVIFGNLSNLFDRLVYGCVFDFIKLDIFNIQIFIFNISDFFFNFFSGVILKIKKLSNKLISMICANEIIYRPSYVLKELIENSCDALSKNIFIYILGCGFDLIKVVDNGLGMNKSDLYMSLQRNTTNRIFTLDDLNYISTYGFRGEALFLISSVCDIEIFSKPKSESIGYKINNSYYKIIPTSHNNGTTAIVRNYKLKNNFFDNKKLEFYNLYNVFKSIVLSNSHIHFKFIHNNKLYNDFPICLDYHSKLKRIESICGKDSIFNSININFFQKNFNLSGIISNLETTGYQYKYRYFFINNRLIYNKLLFGLLKNVYKTAKGMYCSPSFCLYLKIDLNLINVNVTSKKNDVKFINPKQIYNFIYHNILNVLNNNKKIYIKTKLNKYINIKLKDEKKDISIENYVRINSNINVKDLYISKNGILTVLNNKFLFFKYDNNLFISKIESIRKKIIFINFYNDIHTINKISSIKLSTFFCINIDYDIYKNNNNLFLFYGFWVEKIGINLILIKSIPKLLYNFKVNWKCLISDLFKLFDKHKKNYSNDIVSIFIKHIYKDDFIYKYELEKFYEKLIQLKNLKNNWFYENCFEILCDDIIK